MGLSDPLPFAQNERRKEMIKHIKRWNKWRKYNGNPPFHKILVLLGLVKSPSYYMVDGFHNAMQEVKNDTIK